MSLRIIIVSIWLTSQLAPVFATAKSEEYKSICLTSQNKFEDCLRLAVKKGYNLDKQRWLALGIAKGYVIPKDLLSHVSTAGSLSLEDKKKFSQVDMDKVFNYYKAILLDLWGQLDDLSEGDHAFFKAQLESLEGQVHHLSFPGGYTPAAISRLDQLIDTLKAFLNIQHQKKDMGQQALSITPPKTKNDPSFVTKSENTKKPLEEETLEPVEIESSAIFGAEDSAKKSNNPHENEMSPDIPPYQPDGHSKTSASPSSDEDDTPAE